MWVENGGGHKSECQWKCFDRHTFAEYEAATCRSGHCWTLKLNFHWSYLFFLMFTYSYFVFSADWKSQLHSHQNFCLHRRNSWCSLEIKRHKRKGNNCPMPKKWITVTWETRLIKKRKKRGESLWFCNRVVYMHISWFRHIGHTTVRPWRPKPLLKGLSSKAGEKITPRLRVLSRAGLLQ